MRFIRQEHIISTIINRNISDVDIIKDVLENLLKSKIFFSIVIKKNFQSDYSYHTISHNKTRVKGVSDNTADFTVYDRSSRLKISNLSFDDIVEIRAITEKNEILKTHPDISRFGLMDIEEDE